MLPPALRECLNDMVTVLFVHLVSTVEPQLIFCRVILFTLVLKHFRASFGQCCKNVFPLPAVLIITVACLVKFRVRQEAFRNYREYSSIRINLTRKRKGPAHEINLILNIHSPCFHSQNQKLEVYIA